MNSAEKEKIIMVISALENVKVNGKENLARVLASINTLSEMISEKGESDVTTT